MEELMKDVLIKDVTNRGVDEVFIVDNLPKSLLYRRVHKMIIDYTDPQNRQLLVLDFEVLENGMKRRTGAMTDELLPGIERDPNDDAYVFHTEINSSKEALLKLDRYVEISIQGRFENRIPYAAQPGNHNSNPIARHQIPRVVLPEVVSPPVLVTAQTQAPRALSEGSIPQAPANRQIPDPETGAKDRMAKARAAKAAKAAQK